jgi:hypothetical protein
MLQTRKVQRVMGLACYSILDLKYQQQIATLRVGAAPSVEALSMCLPLLINNTNATCPPEQVPVLSSNCIKPMQVGLNLGAADQNASMCGFFGVCSSCGGAPNRLAVASMHGAGH